MSSAAAASGGEDVPVTNEEATPAPKKEEPTAPVAKKKKTYKELRAEGGPLTFNTPIGALNPFAIYYFVTSVVLGIPWFLSCKLCQFMYWITRNKFDPKVRA